MKPLSVISAVLMLAAMSGCVSRQAPGVPASPPEDLRAAFHAAIADAAIRLDRNIYAGLTAVTRSNDDLVWRTDERRQLSVVVFTSAENADRFYRSPDGSRLSGRTPGDRPRLWVTVVPELRRFCQRLRVQDPTSRLKQYVGVDPEGAYNLLVEMWVAPEDLFRPCPDPEVDDTVCELSSGDNNPTVKGIPDYRDFLLLLHEESYRADGVPWTGLGYTYDWADPARKIGASEFMLVPKAPYEVHSVHEPSAYCAAGQ